MSLKNFDLNKVFIIVGVDLESKESPTSNGKKPYIDPGSTRCKPFKIISSIINSS